MNIVLPWPPSINRYYRTVKGRILISSEGRAYRKAICDRVGGAVEPLRGRVGVRVLAHPPDARKRDLDNLFKPLLDALQHAGVYPDDGAIDDLGIRRGEKRPGGEVLVTAWEISNG